MLSGKKVLIGITGAIAAYKTLELIRLFKKNNAEVKIVVTPNALEFVTKTTLRTLSQNEVFIEQFDYEKFKPEHISLTDYADIFLIVPASADTIGKIANGICDNLLTSTACAYKGPFLLAPCMNTGMWENQFVQKNISSLKSAGGEFVEPEDGFLACGCNGKGRLADINVIFERAKNILLENQILKGKKIIITAGGTKENIDPVRFIGNYSSGKMGIALADNAYSMGADVVLICTFDIGKPYKVITSDTADKMLDAVQTEFTNADSLIMAAAVSDYKVKNPAINKIKKENVESLTLELVKNPDILHTVSSIKKEKQSVIGFCAESENLLENAVKKLEQKKCDYIIANDILKSDIGFSSDYNEVFIIDKYKNVNKLEKDTKNAVAEKILKAVYGKN